MTIYNWENAEHICYVDCKPVFRESDGEQVGHMFYPTSPTSAAGRYQYDRNREIYAMGKGARAAMRATGQGDTRTNREWNLARKLFKDAAAEFDGTAKSDALYRDAANQLFGPDHRPYVKRSIRSRARASKAFKDAGERLRERRISSQAGLASLPRRELSLFDREILKHSRPAYLFQSEHDPNL